MSAYLVMVHSLTEPSAAHDARAHTGFSSSFTALGWKTTAPTLQLCPLKVSLSAQLGTDHTLHNPLLQKSHKQMDWTFVRSENIYSTFLLWCCLPFVQVLRCLVCIVVVVCVYGCSCLVCIVVVVCVYGCSCLVCIVISCLVCIVVVVCVYGCSCLVCIVVVVCVYGCSCLVCIVVVVLCVLSLVVLCVLLSSYVYLLYYVCIAVFTLDTRLLARSQFPEGPATGHLDTGVSWFTCVYKQMLRWFPTFQVATTCFSCSPPDLNL